MCAPKDIRQTPLLHRMCRALAALAAGRDGNVAPLLAVAIIPLVAAIGLSIDGARGWLVKARLSQAIDAAGLAGGRVISQAAQRNADIKMFFDANFPPGYMDAVIEGPEISVDSETTPTKIFVEATATIPTTFMRVVGQKQIKVSAKTVVQREDKGMELVLVMDNTGSMQQSAGGQVKITAVKESATALINSLYGNRDIVPTLWVGIVPYVATVNIGKWNSDWTVQKTTPSYPIARIDRTQHGSGSSLRATVCVTTSVEHTFHDGQIIDIAGSSEPKFNGRFLIRTVSTGNSGVDSGCQFNPADRKNFWYVITGSSTASVTSGTMTASVPPVDYSKAGGVVWTGCVEARPAPYEEEQAEALPDTPETKWAQYFWPSTRGVNFYGANKTRLSPSPSSRYGDNDWGSSGFNGATGMSPATQENANNYNGYGPNFGCGTAITPLQQDKQKILNEIAAMQTWGRSGTMANLGLAWGWRVLSPAWKNKWKDVPPEHPVAYGESLWSKVVILLTDGNNEWYDWSGLAPGCAGWSASSCHNGSYTTGLPEDGDYTAYGRLSERRLGPSAVDIPTATTAIDNRMRLLCSAMKSSGIIIYTIVLQNGDQDLYRECATSPHHAFYAAGAAEVKEAFKEIGDQLANLRLAR